MARGIIAKLIAKMALERGFRGFGASQKKRRKPSVYQGFRTFTLAPKPRVLGSSPSAPAKQKPLKSLGFQRFFFFSQRALKSQHLTNI